MIGRIDVRFVSARFFDPGFEIVRNDDLRDAAEKVKSSDIGLDPGWEVLRESGPGKRVTAGAQGGQKEPRFSSFAGDRIRHRYRLAGVVDKELFPGPVGLTKADIQLPGPLVIKETELAILIPFRVFLPVFQPQETKGHAFAGQFLADVLHYGKAPLLRRLCRMGRKQEGLQTAVIKVRRQGPSQTSLLRPFNVFPDSAACNVAALGHVLVG
jgi:hypothetical protein